MWKLLKNIGAALRLVNSDDPDSNDDGDEESKILKILEASDSENESTKRDEDNKSVADLGCNRVGYVTHFSDDLSHGMIDSCYYFDMENAPNNVKIGDRVAYIAHRRNENSIWIVNKIYAVINEVWETSDDVCNEGYNINGDDKCTTELVDNKHSVTNSAVIESNYVGKVVKREGRVLYIQPGNYNCNLDKLSTTFIPVEGDWVVLKTLVEVDDDAVDRCGKVLHIDSLMPLRSRLQNGKITHWESQYNKGIIDSQTLFTLDTCDLGYFPVVGDEVLADVIESEQGGLVWRALTVVPMSASCIWRRGGSKENNKTSNNDDCDSDATTKGRRMENIVEETQQDLFCNKNGIIITEHCNFGDVNINSQHEIVVNVRNESHRKQDLLNASFKSSRLQTQSQIKLVSPNLTFSNHHHSTPLIIYENSTVKFIFRVKARFFGRSSELFVWKFRGFEIGRRININVVDSVCRDIYNSKIKRYKKKENIASADKIFATRNGFIISSEKKFRPAPFVPVKLGQFPVPRRLWETVLGCNTPRSYIETRREIEEVFPCLCDSLNENNYKERWHALLYLEEVYYVANMIQYNMPRANFKRSGDFLVLEIPGLAEKRPSIVCGDTVIISNPCAVSAEGDVKYEGSVYKVCKGELYLKFNRSFHDTYNGADYSVSFNVGRVGFRRSHQAINVAYDHLLTSWLFPTHLKESELQIIFIEEEEKEENKQSTVKEASVCMNKVDKDSFDDSNVIRDKNFIDNSKINEGILNVSSTSKNCRIFNDSYNAVGSDRSQNTDETSDDVNHQNVKKLLPENHTVNNSGNSTSLSPRLSVAENLKISLKNCNNKNHSNSVPEQSTNECNKSKNCTSGIDNLNVEKLTSNVITTMIDNNVVSKNESFDLNKLFNITSSCYNNSHNNINKVLMKSVEEIEKSLFLNDKTCEKDHVNINKMSSNDLLLLTNKNKIDSNLRNTHIKEQSDAVNDNFGNANSDLQYVQNSSYSGLENQNINSSDISVVACCKEGSENSNSVSTSYSNKNNSEINWQSGSDGGTNKSYKRQIPNTYKRKLKWYNSNLNWYQKEAVKNILKGETRPLPYIIFGPPGTGKTVTLVETALQLFHLLPESRLLIGTPSNSAANLISERLLDSGIMEPGMLIRFCSYNYLNNDNINISDRLYPYCAVASIKVIEDELLGTVPDQCNVKCVPREVLGRHRVTVGTCVTLGILYNMGFPRGHFTHVLIDEAGQATEPEILIPLALLDEKYGQAILAGDPRQLGPSIFSNYAKSYSLGESLLSRLLSTFPYKRDVISFPDTCGFDPRVITRLVYNYRSLPEILNLPSSMFYDSSLVPQIKEVGSEEARILLSLKDELPLRDDTTEDELKRILPPALVFHGVRGVNFQEEDSPSWFNPQEMVQVIFYVNVFYKVGLTADEIGIVTPYQKQVMKIRSCLNKLDIPLPKVGSVEEFQGQERMAIILSLVRSSSKVIIYDNKYSLGFISSPQRLNVALTRGRAIVIVIGNPHLLSCDPYWRTVLKYCIKNKAYCGCDLPSALDE
ncbi:putative RNA helicase armitage [Lycorma delicatula]|uniref:putative RNA helicase armitage n=1 Tax=Lycorma delicatula TaxID=130591 RepID=UPI003F514962